MIVKKLELQAFKAFENISFDAHERLNVFIGENGSGKSSLLEALSFVLGSFYYDVKSKIFSLERLQLIQKNNSKQEWEINIHTENTKFKLSKSIISKKVYKLHSNPLYLSYLKSIDDNASSSPILSYYSAYRTISPELITINLDDTLKNNSQALLSKETLIKPVEALVFKDFMFWIRLREDIENQYIRDQRNYKDKELTFVKKAINSFLDYDDLRVFRNPDSLKVRNSKDKEWYDIRQLSDGERGFLCLVGDIARRLSIANPSLKNPLKGQGIILIDEIELHLHPKWQRMAIPKLLEIFPYCQFFITTHSPQTISEIKDTKSLWIIGEDKNLYNPERLYGLNSNEILTEIMNAENQPKELTEELEKIDILINDEKYDNARKKIKDFAKEHGSIPALIGMNTMLTMMGEEQADLKKVD